MPSADLILKNARVITMEPDQPITELVAIKGDKILLVAGDKELDLGWSPEPVEAQVTEV